MNEGREFKISEESRENDFKVIYVMINTSSKLLQTNLSVFTNPQLQNHDSNVPCTNIFQMSTPNRNIFTNSMSMLNVTVCYKKQIKRRVLENFYFSKAE